MSPQRYSTLLAASFVCLSLTAPLFAMKENEPIQPSELIRVAVRHLVKMQDPSGLWPYQCFDEAASVPSKENEAQRSDHNTASTAIVTETLLLAAPEDKNAQTAVQRGLESVLGNLYMLPSGLDGDAKDMAESRHYWTHVFALELLCQVRARKAAGKQEEKVEKWIRRLVAALIKERHSDGGWTYLGPVRQSQSFLTAPVAQALLLARAQGEPVSDDLLASCRKRLEANRLKNGVFTYLGDAEEVEFEPARKRSVDLLPGSASRSPLCETTLMLLGGGSINAVRFALDNFHQHWAELELHIKRGDTHAGAYGVAPYFFYFGHRYAAQAIQLLPEKDRIKERERLLKLILKTRDADGTWNDRIFPSCSSYGTAMVVLALLGDKAPLPPKFMRK